MRVCINKSTGLLIEAQSGDDAPLETLRQNAINGGYTDDQIEVRVCTEAEFAALLNPPPTEAQLALAARARRDAALAACDWTQMPDAPLTTEARAAWSAYRQALRDVPGQAGFPQAVEWPSAPDA